MIFLWLLSVTAAVLVTAFLEKRKGKSVLREIERTLSAFPDADRVRVYVSEAERDSELFTASDDLSRIRRQLVKIARSVAVTADRVSIEKEETKSIVTDIAHQLKTPAAVMDMSLSLLEDDSLNDEERKEFTERMRSSLTELETLMASLIQISRMETGLISLNIEALPIKTTIMQAVNRIIMKAEEKDINIVFDDSMGYSLMPLPHDPKWLSEAFINILDNAIKYSPSGSVITIKPFIRNGFLRLEFMDQGIGIPKEERNKVLGRFYRGKSQVVAQEKGSGVGLYLVEKIVRMHGGMVFIRKGKGVKTEFPGCMIVISIPCQNCLTQL